MQKIELKRVYRHFKGDYYLVEDIARHSETGDEYVVYRKLYGDGSLWIRPLDVFEQGGQDKISRLQPGIPF